MDGCVLAKLNCELERGAMDRVKDVQLQRQARQEERRGEERRREEKGKTRRLDAQVKQ